MGTPIPNNHARFTLGELASAVSGGRAIGEVSVLGEGVFHDSRAVRKGSIFVALGNAHAYVDKAIAQGASIVVVEKEIASAAVAQVVVGDSLIAWGEIAKAHLVKIGPKVVAITGSAGKTTTKELTAALLAKVGPTHFTAGNLNNRIGVPAVIFALETQHEFCVLEMGMSLPGEIDAITSFAPPDVSVIVNVGVAHAEGVGGREGVMHEKGAVYRALGKDDVAIVNADDDYVVRAAQLAEVERQITFGKDAGQYRLVSRTAFDVVLETPTRKLSLHLPLPGEAAAVDLCAALAAQEAISKPLSETDINAALASVRLAGRGTLLDLGDVLVLDDTYNANPSSMRSSLATLAELAAGKRRAVAVLGEMKELGTLADDEHIALGDIIAHAGVSLLIGCGGRMDLTLARAAGRGVKTLAGSTTDEAAKLAVAEVRAGDVVLVKASRSVEAERVVAALKVARRTD